MILKTDNDKTKIVYIDFDNIDEVDKAKIVYIGSDVDVKELKVIPQCHSLVLIDDIFA